MTSTLPISRPRNPLAMPARRRRAGSHRPGRGSMRQQARRACRRELELLRLSP